MKYKIDYQNAVENEHMGMTYDLEECVQIISRDCGFDDCDLEWHETAAGVSVTVDCKREMRSVEIARLIEIEAHTNEEESRLIFEELEKEVTGEVAAALSEVICVTESTYRIVRKALEIVQEIYTYGLDGEDALANAFVAAALLKNVVTKE